MSLNQAIEKMRLVHDLTPEQEEVLRKAQMGKTGKFDLICAFYLRSYFLCSEFKVLPKQGGLDDQDFLVVQYFGVINDEIAEQKRKAAKS